VNTDLAYARRLDAEDELARFRHEFVVEDPDLVYLDGNSLGRLPRGTPTRLGQLIEREWGERLIRGWGDGWLEAPGRVGGKLARLLGAAPDEVIVADSTSVNLFKLVLAALAARPDRHTVVTDELNFPSDLYVLQGAVRLAGPDHRLVVVRSPDRVTGSPAALAQAVDSDTALVTLCHTTFKASYVYDLAAVTAMAHRVGALACWDVSHSVGAMPLALGASGVDLAVGCTYKYLNGGPGAPAFLFVRRDLQAELLSPIWGWLGHRAPFEFAPDYAPAPGISRFLAGTPAILAVAAIEPGVDLVLDAGLERLRAKSIRQTDYLIGLWEAWLAPLDFRLHSPRDASCRGSHVSLGHPEGWRINRALIEEMKVIGDFREPDNLRFGLAPLYTSYAEIHEAMRRLRVVVTERRYAKYSTDRSAVT
jgi:kynureninase